MTKAYLGINSYENIMDQVRINVILNMRDQTISQTNLRTWYKVWKQVRNGVRDPDLILIHHIAEIRTYGEINKL